MRIGTRLACMLVVSAAAIPLASAAAPISVAGFFFANGEDDFAQNAVVVSGTVTGSSAAQVRAVLVGSNISDSIRVITPDIAVIEITFGSRQILNLVGPDAVIFELSGDQAVGTPNYNERFEVSVFNGTNFTPFQVVIPLATGFDDPADATLDVFAVQLDLSDYGIAAGASTDRIRIRLVDNLVTRSADPTAVGLLHSVPEPPTISYVGAVLLIGFAVRASFRTRSPHNTR